jgi:thiamine biosynthesis protein ThiS
MQQDKTRTIEIVVNGGKRTAAEGQSLLDLLYSLELDPSRVAVEMNGRIVRQPDWETTALEDGASIEIVHFVGGG